MILTWKGDRAVGPDGRVYLLASEDLSGRHGARMWEVFAYDAPGKGASEVLNVDGDGWPTKRRARARAERDARERVDAGR